MIVIAAEPPFPHAKYYFLFEFILKYIENLFGILDLLS